MNTILFDLDGTLIVLPMGHKSVLYTLVLRIKGAGYGKIIPVYRAAVSGEF